ncbi:MAG TPA: hypothetical protein VGI63_10280 [Verrucomicrobiae bacterium]|jgi:hypothetical protein
MKKSFYYFGIGTIVIAIATEKNVASFQSELHSSFVGVVSPTQFESQANPDVNETQHESLGKLANQAQLSGQGLFLPSGTTSGLGSY